MIHRGRAGTFVLFLFTAACGGGAEETTKSTFNNPTPSASPFASGTPSSSPSTTGDPASPFTEVTDSIVAIIPAADIGEDGQPVDPGFNFSPDTPQITIVARAGDVTSSPMSLTWFQVTDQAEAELFTHTVQVGRFEAVFSVGTNPGTLTAGAYRVEAILEGEISSTTFEVEAPDTEASLASIAGALAPARMVAGQGATSGPPTSGSSGTVEFPSTGLTETYLYSLVDYVPIDPDAPGIKLYVAAAVLNGTGRLEARATMAGRTQNVFWPVEGNAPTGRVLHLDPCVYPGGSDLPGATAQFEAILYAGDAVWGSRTHATTLGPDKTDPLVAVTSIPPLGSKVGPGRSIVISIVGSEARGGTWQTGVKRIVLKDFDTGQIVREQTFGERAMPCQQKAWSKGLDIPYTIPSGGRSEIHLVAEVFDFANRKGTFGFKYLVGEVWEGTVQSVVTVEGPGGPCGNPLPIGGTARFIVASDGTVTGTYDVTGCGISEPHAEFTGTVTDEQFLFPVLIVFANGEPIPKVSPTHAQGTFTNHQGPNTTWVTTWDMTCTSCE